MSNLGTPVAAGRTAEIYPWENDCVLKLIRAEFPAHLADQEWSQSEAAWNLGAAAPRPVALIEVDGRRGVVFRRIMGPTMLRAMVQKPLRMDIQARLLGRMHAALHKLSAPGFPSLHGRVRTNLLEADLLSAERKAAVLDLLARLPDADTLCHGDFHPENILLAETGPVIIDWEGSMHASAAGDVANTCLWIRSGLTFYTGRGGWVIRRIGRHLERVYLDAYRREHGPLDHLPEWLAVLAACRMKVENGPKVRQFEVITRRVLPGW